MDNNNPASDLDSQFSPDYTNPPTVAAPMATPNYAAELEAFAKPDYSKGTQMANGNEPTTVKFGKGVLQGGRDVLSTLDPAAEWLDNKLGNPTLGGTFPSALETHNSNVAAANQFDQQYGNSLAGGFGRATGNLLASAPLMGAGGKVIGATAGLAADAFPAIENLGTSINALSNGSWLGQGVSNAAKGAVQGAGISALTSGGSNNSLADDIGSGAETGALFGVAAPVLTEGAKSIGNYAKQMVMGPEDFAIAKILQNLGRDGQTPDTIKNALTQAGPESSLMDVSGKNMQGFSGAIGNAPGEGQSTIANFLNARQAGQSERLLNSATSGLGIDPAVGYQGTVDSLLQKRAADAAPLYQKAFEATPVTSDRLNQFWNDPIMQGGLAKGKTIQRLEAVANGEPYNPSDQYISGWQGGDYETGEPVMSNTPNMRLLDAGKKGLDSIISDNTDPVTGKVNEYGRSVTQFKNSFLNEVDNLNPDYADARSSYAGPSQSLSAVQNGKNFIRNGAVGNAQELANMSDTDKQFFRVGVGQAISDTLDGTPDGANAVNRLFGTPAKQKALASVFPDQDSFDQFSQAVQNEKQFYQTKQSILGGSQTQPRMAAAADAGNLPIDFGDVASVAKGNYAKALLSVGGKIANQFSGLTPARGAASANLLTNPDQAELIKKLVLGNSPGSLDSVTNPLLSYLSNRSAIGGTALRNALVNGGGNPNATQ